MAYGLKASSCNPLKDDNDNNIDDSECINLYSHVFWRYQKYFVVWMFIIVWLSASRLFNEEKLIQRKVIKSQSLLRKNLTHMDYGTLDCQRIVLFLSILLLPNKVKMRPSKPMQDTTNILMESASMSQRREDKKKNQHIKINGDK